LVLAFHEIFSASASDKTTEIFFLAVSKRYPPHLSLVGSKEEDAKGDTSSTQLQNSRLL